LRAQVLLSTRLPASSLRNSPIGGLFGSNQAPGALLERLSKYADVCRRGTQVSHGFTDLGFVGAHDIPNIRQNGLCRLERLFQFSEVVGERLPNRGYGVVDVDGSLVSVLDN